VFVKNVFLSAIFCSTEPVASVTIGNDYANGEGFVSQQNNNVLLEFRCTKGANFVKLIEVNIENFRGIRSLRLPPGGLTVLISENNAGKSTVLEAIKLLLTRGSSSRRAGQFTEYDFHLAGADAIPRTAQRYLQTFEAKIDPAQNPLPKRRGKKPIRNESFVDLRTELYRISGVDFTQIPGLDALTVQTIITEIGLDPSKFLTEKRFVSWLGLCPNNRITGGEVKRTKTRKTVNRAANAFRMAAQTLANCNAALGGFYRRIHSRLGSPKAITATAHKHACYSIACVDDRPGLYRPGQGLL
jgi:Transposase IS116/IS110/IS902 family/AAA ATPase domain